MQQVQVKKLKRGKRRKDKDSCIFILGHPVNNRLTVINRWSAIFRESSLYVFFRSRPTCGLLLFFRFTDIALLHHARYLKSRSQASRMLPHFNTGIPWIACLQNEKQKYGLKILEKTKVEENVWQFLKVPESRW